MYVQIYLALTFVRVSGPAPRTGYVTFLGVRACGRASGVDGTEEVLLQGERLCCVLWLALGAVGGFGGREKHGSLHLDGVYTY